MGFKPIIELLGKVNFGALTVESEGESYTSPRGNSYRRFLCRCECGNTRLFSSPQLKSGKRVSCGCNSKVRIKSTIPHVPPHIVDPRDLPKTNKEAAALGIQAYYTGEPCKSGHIAFRWVSNQWCSQCANDAGKSYRDKIPFRSWARSCVQNARSSSELKNVPFSLTIDYVLSIRKDICPALGIALVYPSGQSNGKLTDFSPTLDRTIPSRGYVPGNILVISHRANRIKNNASSTEIQMVASWLRSIEDAEAKLLAA